MKYTLYFLGEDSIGGTKAPRASTKIKKNKTQTLFWNDFSVTEKLQR